MIRVPYNYTFYAMTLRKAMKLGTTAAPPPPHCHRRADIELSSRESDWPAFFLRLRVAAIEVATEAGLKVGQCMVETTQKVKGANDLYLCLGCCYLCNSSAKDSLSFDIE